MKLDKKDKNKKGTKKEDVPPKHHAFRINKKAKSGKATDCFFNVGA